MARIDPLFKEMGAAGASDLHMVAGRPPMLRLRGDLVATKHKSLSHEINEKLFSEILTPQQMEQLRTTYELDCFTQRSRQSHDSGAIFFYQQRGISGVFRFIPNEIIPLEKLGMPAGVLRILEIERGLVVVVGPTGCGKSNHSGLHDRPDQSHPGETHYNHRGPSGIHPRKSHESCYPEGGRVNSHQLC